MYTVCQTNFGFRGGFPPTRIPNRVLPRESPLAFRSRPAATHRGGGEGPPGLTRPRILGEGLLSVMSESPLDGPSKVSFRTEPGPRARARVKDRVRPKDRALNHADRAQSSDRVGPQHDHLLIGQPPCEFPPAESASGIRPRPPPPQHCRKHQKGEEQNFARVVKRKHI